MAGPLSGLKILDLSRLLPGPLMTRLFADLGADVVKVESPGAPDPVRFVPPLDGEISCAFRALNRGKRSVALDLKSEEGRERYFALADRADAVVESFRPGVIDRLGVGYEALRARRADAILCSITGFGQSGADARRAGHDLGYLARAGVLTMSGGEGGRVDHPGVQLADIAGGSLSAGFGLLAALFRRDRTGQGAHLDVSMTRGAMVTLVMALGQALEERVRTHGEHDLAGALPCYSLYRTRDGRSMALAALEPKFFQAFCTRIGRPELASSGWSRGDEGVKIRAELAAIFAEKTQAEWAEFLGDTDCCCEPVRTPEEALADPAVGLASAQESRTRILATDVGFGPRVAAGEAPTLGQHDHEVAVDWGLGPAKPGGASP